jgi:cell fate regulator YaaT (PSP1 superfamily)
LRIVIHHHFIRVGALGQVGRFRSVAPEALDRTNRVVCRTPRGLEIGQVLSAAPAGFGRSVDGVVIRRMTDADELLHERIERYRRTAYQKCRQRLADRQMVADLIDVECLFDGSTLYFHFLGEVPPAVDAMVAELADAFDTGARLRAFARTLAEGCGPGCGTGEQKGCGSDCTTCVVSHACGRLK